MPRRSMGRQWNLPDEFITLVQHHTTLDEMLNTPGTPPGQLAVALWRCCLPAPTTPGTSATVSSAAFQALCPAGGPTIVEFLEKIDHEFAEFAPLMKIATPAKSLAASYQESTQPTA